MSLFKTAQELKQFFSTAQKNLDIESVRSYIDEAEQLYIKTYLGSALYASLTASYEAETMTNDEQILLKKIQPALANFVVYGALQAGGVFFSDLGAQETSTGYSHPAKEQSLQRLIAFTASRGDSNLNLLLDFLEANTTIYPTWQSSDYYIKSRQLLLHKSTDFVERYPMQNSVLGYHILRPTIRLAEKKYIENTISEEFLANLKAKQIAGTLNTEEAKAVDIAKDALVHYTMYEALPSLALDIATNSLRATVFTNPDKQASQVDIKMMLMLKEQAQQNASMYLTSLKKYLDKNADTFSIYQNSDKYIAPPTTRSYEQVDNSNSTIFFMK